MSNKAQNKSFDKDRTNLPENKIINKNIIKKNHNYPRGKSNRNKSFNNSQNLPNNIIYQKPSIKLNDFISNNNSLDENNIGYKYNQNLDIDDNSQINNIIENNIKDNIMRGVSDDLKKHENKTVIDLNETQNNQNYGSKEYEIEKIQQENLKLKADSIIFREDIIHLSEINKKLKEELEIEKRKIYTLISKGEEAIQILNNKNYEITQLTETISNLKLSTSPDIINNIKNNKTKEQLIYELQFKLNNLNNDKIKIETEKNILEEQYNNIINENKIIIKEDELYKNNFNNNINVLENKIKKLEKDLDELNIKNNELKIESQKNNNNIERLKIDKNNFENKYQIKKNEYNELENEFKKLENKYSQLLYDIQKQKFIKEKKKSEEKIEMKRKKKKSSKQLIVNDLYNKIQNLKQKVKNEREINN